MTEPKLITAPYAEQVARWPDTGKVILAQFDAESVVVYQAYGPAIGRFAAEHGHFGGDFKMSRMTWVKPNFLWMMYRSGWGTKPGQEVTLAVRLKRSAFDTILSQAVHSAYQRHLFATRGAWQQAVSASDVRLQWDPDHDPRGSKQERRAIQLGLRGAAVRRYAGEWLLGIEDISEFVAAQREFAGSGRYDLLRTPREEVYPVEDPGLARRLGMDGPGDAAGAARGGGP